jgi:ABC-type dipeptide/oligopeptide/nickel transport system ATPase component
MNDGQIVEEGEASEITNNPKEEYTRILMNSVLSVD